LDARVKYALGVAEADGIIKVNQVIVLVTGWQKGSGYTNTIRIVPFRQQK
jgi:hypothetical protein